jgi:hypothetical protein
MPAKFKNAFTDKQLSDLYGGLKKQYDLIIKNNPAISYPELFDKLTFPLVAEINSTNGKYGALDPSEQAKVYSVRDAFLSATPEFRNEKKPMPARATNWFNWENFRSTYPLSPRPTIQIVNVYHTHDRASWFNDFALRYMIMSSFSNNNTKNKKQSEDCLKAIAILIAVVAVVLSLYYASMYLMNVVLDSVDRIAHNEGWFQASVSILSAAIGAIVGALAIMATLNPVGVLGVLAVASASVITAAVTALLTNTLQDALIKHANPDALDPNDPHRIKLSVNEAANLKVPSSRGIQDLDPIKVKCAIAALRADIGPMPSATVRFFSSSGAKASRNLNLIRKLRAGELDASMDPLVVGDMQFNLRRTREAEAVVANDVVGNPVLGQVVG